MSALIGMGGNVGDPKNNLREALALIQNKFTLLKKSSLYRTAAVGGPDGQPDCYNAVIEVDPKEFDPRKTLAYLHEIERKMGRVRKEKWGPRIIDLDLLDQDGVIIDESDISIPHPMISERSFVLGPLREIYPEWKHPVSGKTAEQLWNKLPESDKSVILAIEEWSS